MARTIDQIKAEIDALVEKYGNVPFDQFPRLARELKEAEA